MIYFYSGTPGSGKSLHCARDIYNKLFIKKENVIANFPINEQMLNKKKKKGKFAITFSFLINNLLYISLAQCKLLPLPGVPL